MHLRIVTSVNILWPMTKGLPSINLSTGGLHKSALLQPLQGFGAVLLPENTTSSGALSCDERESASTVTTVRCADPFAFIAHIRKRARHSPTLVVDGYRQTEPSALTPDPTILAFENASTAASSLGHVMPSLRIDRPSRVFFLANLPSLSISFEALSCP